MSTALTPSLRTSFAQLSDPRRPGRTLAFSLGEIITIALCAAIGGANDWVAVETFGKAKLAWFQRFLSLEQGIPSHDTFGRVFARLDPIAFQNCFRDWIAGVCERLGIRHAAIDGKRLAGSLPAHFSATRKDAGRSGEQGWSTTARRRATRTRVLLPTDGRR